MSPLIRLYPRAWRARYESEFLALIDERPPTARDVLDIVRGALDARLSRQVGATEPRAVRAVQRLPGLAAIAGGLLWCGLYLGPGLSQADGDWAWLIGLALALMLLSLPGAYVAAYERPVAVAVGALVLSLAFGRFLPWGPLLLVPVVIVVGVLGAGSLALAAARAGVPTRERWLMLGVCFGPAVVGGFLAASGLFSSFNAVPLAVAAGIPYGLAWMLLGSRLVRGQAMPPHRPNSGPRLSEMPQ